MGDQSEPDLDADLGGVGRALVPGTSVISVVNGLD
jgi:hypothetical protein